MANRAILATSFTQRDKDLLNQALGGQGNNGGGGTPLPHDPNAIHVGSAAGGDLAGTYPNPILSEAIKAYLLNRGNHVGAWYAQKFFPNHYAGFVLSGSPNNTQWRLKVDDTDETAPTVYVDSYAGPVVGDVLMENNGAGPVLRGRYSGNLYRIGITDAEPDAPILTVTQLASDASIAAADYQFSQGYEFHTKGQTQRDFGRYYWTWFIDDTQPDPVLWVERFAP